MKILVVSHRTFPTLGGLEKHIFAVSKEITERNSIKILNLGFSSKETDINKINTNFSIKAIKSLFILNKSYPIPFLSGIKYFLEIYKFKPDIIHAHGRYFISTIIAFCFAKLFKKPFILTEHIEGPIYFSNIKVSRAFNYIFDKFILTLKKSNTLFSVVSKAAKEFYKNNYNIEAYYTPNFIIPSEIEESRLVNYKFPESYKKFENNILFSGRLVESKGYKDLEKYVESNKNTMFIVVGEGEGESYINRLCNKYLNLRYIKSLVNLKFLNLMSQVDGILMLSKQEGLSTTVMEAMALGKLIITNNLKSNIELVSKYKKTIILDKIYIEDKLSIFKNIKQASYMPNTLDKSASGYLRLYRLANEKH